MANFLSLIIRSGGAQLGSVVIQFLLIVLLARTLPQIEFGKWIFFSSFLNIATLCILFGLQQDMPRIIQKARDTFDVGNEIYDLIIFTAFNFIVFIVIILVFRNIFYDLLQFTNSNILILLIGIVFIRVLLQLVASIVRAYRMVASAIFIAPISFSVVFFLCLLLCSIFVFELSYITILVLYFFSCFCSIVLVTILFSPYVLKFWKLKYKIKVSITSYMVRVRQLAPIFIAVVTHVLTIELFIWLARSSLSYEDLALYGAAARIVLVIALFITFVTLFAPPYLSKPILDKDLRLVEAISKVLTFFCSVPASIVVVLLVVFSEQVLKFIYGVNYVEAANLLRIMSIGQAINVMTGICGLILVLSERRVEVMSISVFYLLITILAVFLIGENLNLFFLGGLYSLLIIMINVTSLLFVKKYLDIWASGLCNLEDFRIAFGYFRSLKSY